MERSLTPRQCAFVSEYLVDLNATAAARRAGYSARTASQTGFDLLRKPQIQAAIQDGARLRAERTQITADRVLRELGRIAFADARRMASWGGTRVQVLPSARLDDDSAAAVVDVAQDRQGVRIRLADKLRALELIGKHLGLFTDRPSSTPAELAETYRQFLLRIDLPDISAEEYKARYLTDHGKVTAGVADESGQAACGPIPVPGPNRPLTNGGPGATM